jgi:hypothetical protein
MAYGGVGVSNLGQHAIARATKRRRGDVDAALHAIDATQEV